eukprot:PLAT10332.1.p1 GENE.PLAT10332.1~~PLAT10332.1.p1  ORF type:complete len:271 (+),score=113.47 PLAT10332.1:89-901(+)
MAVGKNKRLVRGKKGKRKVVDPWLKKEWYTVRSPSMFVVRDFCKTPVSPSAGLKIASEGLKGRVFEVSLADLNNDEDLSYRKMRLKAEEVEGRTVLTNFYGMDFTRDRLCGLIKKWQTLIEAYVNVRTTDGYVLRLFCIGFTKKRGNQLCKTSYAQAGQIRRIRARMVDIMSTEASKCDLRELVNKFIPEVIGREIEKACSAIYPMQHCYIRKVKMLKAPRYDVTKLMELHNESLRPADLGRKVEVEDEDEEPADEEAATKPLPGSGGRL